MMQTLVPKGRANYEPNSLNQAGEDSGPRASVATGFSTFETNDERNNPAQKLRQRDELFADHYSQARMFFRSQTESERTHIVSAIVFELSKVQLAHVRQNVVSNLRNIEEDLARRVADGLGIDLPAKSSPKKEPIDMPVSDALSIQKNALETLEGRKIGVLIDDGSNKSAVDKLLNDIKQQGGTPFVVARKVGGVKLNGGTMPADGQLAGSPSFLFDAIVSILAPEAAQKLTKEAAAIQWFMDAYAHCKTIGYCPATKALLDKANVEMDEGVVPVEDFLKVGAKRHWDREPLVRDLP